MRRMEFVLVGLALCGCDLSQDLGGGDDNAGGSTGSDETGGSDNGGKGALGGSGGTGNAAAGGTGNVGATGGFGGEGGSISVGGGGGEGGAPPDPCGPTPGYPSAQGAWAEIAGGYFAGSYALIDSTLCGNAGSGFDPEIFGKFVALAWWHGQAPGDGDHQFMLAVDGPSPPTPGTYPLVASFLRTSPVSLDSAETTSGDLYYYPAVNGQGSCTIVVDEAKTHCIRATYSCAGLVGMSSGEAISVSNGVVVCGD